MAEGWRKDGGSGGKTWRLCMKNNSATQPALMPVFGDSITLSLLLVAWRKGSGYVGELGTYPPSL